MKFKGKSSKSMSEQAEVNFKILKNWFQFISIDSFELKKLVASIPSTHSDGIGYFHSFAVTKNFEPSKIWTKDRHWSQIFFVKTPRNHKKNTHLGGSWRRWHGRHGNGTTEPGWLVNLFVVDGNATPGEWVCLGKSGQRDVQLVGAGFDGQLGCPFATERGTVAAVGEWEFFVGRAASE